MAKSYGHLLLRRMRIRQKHLSEITGIHFVRLSDLLTLKKAPTPDEAKAICYFFDRDEQEIFENIGGI